MECGDCSCGGLDPSAFLVETDAISCLRLALHRDGIPHHRGVERDSLVWILAVSGRCTKRFSSDATRRCRYSAGLMRIFLRSIGPC